MTINEALVEARLDAGMTQKEVAEHMGVTQTRISRIETGSGSFPSISQLVQLADLYKISLDKLVGRNR